LIATFLYFYEKEDLKYNIVLAATAEEISGHNGIDIVAATRKIDFFCVEGNSNEMAMAEEFDGIRLYLLVRPDMLKKKVKILSIKQ
jgi:acetylornithine deacetylase